MITNVKDTSNNVIYQFDLAVKGGTISGNVITLAFDTTSMIDTDPLQIWVDLPASSAGSVNSKIEGDISGNIAEVTASKALLVTNVTTPPPATTPVLESFLNSSNGTLDNFYVIPSGQTLTLQLFRSGSEGSAICSAYTADDGTNPNDVTKPLAISYLLANNDSQIENFNIVGDGTRAIRLRREAVGGGGSREMYVSITGYLT